MAGKVFVTKRPCRRGPDGEFIDTYDLSPAEKHGELVDVLPRGLIPSDLQATWALMKEALADFDESDSLLCVGDPVGIAMAVMVANWKTFGVIRLLKWDRRAGEYEVVLLDVSS